MAISIGVNWPLTVSVAVGEATTKPNTRQPRNTKAIAQGWRVVNRADEEGEAA